MIPDRDIWRAANLLIRDYSADAEIVAAQCRNSRKNPGYADDLTN
jgi:hypothetical protein